MFIREIRKKNPGYQRTFTYHRLMESVRTRKGPRQVVLLNLGHLELPPEDWKSLANRIEEILLSQSSFVPPRPAIESLAQHYGQMLRRRELQSIPASLRSERPGQETYWETVDLNSLAQGDYRTLGGEMVAYEAFQEQGLPEILSRLGFNEGQIQQAALLVIGRLLHPASERETALWGKEISALAELIGTDFHHLSNNALYRLSDELVGRREEIENLLAQRERQGFGLGEKIILYDLTNVYLTGRAHQSGMAHHGHSKEKRDDCPLLTLAMVLDEDGFPKKSKVLPGNASEPDSLKGFLKAYKTDLSRRQPLFQELPTVVVDAGVGTQANLDLIRGEGFHYITVSRTRPVETPAEEELVLIKCDKDSTIKAKRLDRDGEVILYCESSARARKEQSMKARFQRWFEDGLERIASSITRKGGHKGYGKVMERLGRLKERYPIIARFYEVDVQEERGRVMAMKWTIDEEKELEARFSGSYYIRSSRTDLDEKPLWSLYMMLVGLEEAFRCLKSDLGLRPVYHRKDPRQEGHLFITVLAYHVLATIQRKLKEKGISHRWSTLRSRLATHQMGTVSMTNDKGERILQRQPGYPEPYHLEIYRALGLAAQPLKIKRVKKT